MEDAQNVYYAAHSLKVEFQVPENTTLINVETAKHVELLQSAINPKSQYSLFGYLNRCTTPGGVKSLRSNLFQPPVQMDVIVQRQEAVEELMRKPDMSHALQGIIGRFFDMDRLLASCVMIPRVDSTQAQDQRLNNIIGLKHAVELVEALQSALENGECTLLTRMFDVLRDESYSLILDKVNGVLQDTARVQKGAASMKRQRCFAVRNGLDGLLDLTRQSYCEIVEEIEEIVANLSREHGLPMRAGFNASRGYHVQLQQGNKRGRAQVALEDLPGRFLQPTQNKNVISFTTEEIIQADRKIQEALRDITRLSDKIVRTLQEDITNCIGCLYRLSDIVSALDVLLALAEVSQSPGYSRPSFGNSLIVQAGRHPILEYMAVDDVVPNDTSASVENNLLVLTGANMSGKSTYLKQIVLLQVRTNHYLRRGRF